MTAVLKKPEQKNYSLKEAADYLRVSHDTVRRYIKRGLLRRSYAARKIVIPGEDVENLVTTTC